MEFKDLGLRESPFRIIPPSEPTKRWAGRRELRQQLLQLVETWRANPESGIYLVWADLGAGKTHAMRYIQGLLLQCAPPGLSIYTDLPDAARDFKEVYSQVVPSIPEDALSTAILAFRRASTGRDWLANSFLKGDRDTPQAMWVISELGNQQQGSVARRWLRGDRVNAHESALIGNLSPIRSAEQAIRTLSTLVRLLSRFGGYSRVVLMLDEFQRVGQVSTKSAYDINAGIKSVYDSCSEGLSIMLSYSFGDQVNIKYLATPELLNRVRAHYPLPLLTVHQAVEFVKDLVRLASNSQSKQQVFKDDAILAVVRKLDVDARHRLTPRRISQVFGGIMDRAMAGRGIKWPLSLSVVLKFYAAPIVDQVDERTGDELSGS